MRWRPGRSNIAVSCVGVESPLSNQKFRAVLTDVFAGMICSILSYCLLYAALIFTGPLEHVLVLWHGGDIPVGRGGRIDCRVAQLTSFRDRRTLSICLNGLACACAAWAGLPRSAKWAS